MERDGERERERERDGEREREMQREREREYRMAKTKACSKCACPHMPPQKCKFGMSQKCIRDHQVCKCPLQCFGSKEFNTGNSSSIFNDFYESFVSICLNDQY